MILNRRFLTSWGLWQSQETFWVVWTWVECSWHLMDTDKMLLNILQYSPQQRITSPQMPMVLLFKNTLDYNNREILLSRKDWNAKLFRPSREAAVTRCHEEVGQTEHRWKKLTYLRKQEKLQRREKKTTNICCWLTTTKYINHHIPCTYSVLLIHTKRKMRFREVGNLQDFTSTKWQCWDSNTGLITKSMLSF